MQYWAADALGRFRGADKGGVAVIAAVALPVLLIAASAIVDYGLASRDRMIMQSVADATALAAARELAIARPTDAHLSSIVNGFAGLQLANHDIGDQSSVSAEIVNNQRGVTVQISRPMTRMLGGLIGSQAFTIKASATANIVGNQRICVVALDEGSIETIYLKSNSQLTAQECNVFSNSASASGIKSDSGIQVTAKLICSSGGFSGGGAFSGRKLTDCPPVKDPLAQRPVPAGQACRAQNHSVIDKGSPGTRHLIAAGTYCGGLFVGGNSVVQFEPGVYTIKDGPLVFDGNADVRGVNVGFYLQGPKATFQFLSNAKVVLDAPKDGAMAGLLFFEDRGVAEERDHVIKSNYVSNLTGTIYLSKGRLVVDATNEVAQQSAFTLIVVKKLYLSASPKLVVKSDYGFAEVPVPAGLGPVSGNPVLTR